MVDVADRHLSAWSCGVESDVHVKNLQVDASVRHIYYRGKVHFDGTPKYGWDVDSERSLELGQIGVSTEYRFINLSAEFSSLPYVAGAIGWQTGDSLLFASASIGRGHFTVGDIQLHLEDAPSSFSEFESDWELRFLKRQLSLGSSLAGHRLQVDFADVHSRPDVEGRYGLTLSDTSDIKAGSLRYSYDGAGSGVNIWLLHAWGDITLEGLHREKIDEDKVDEKRFLYVPLDITASLLATELYLLRRPVVSRNDKASLVFAHAWLDAHIPYIPWKKGRFYPTVAPNQVLDNSVIKLVSLNVYTHNFRVYGDAHVPVWFGGGRYVWGFEGPGWKWHPSVSLYGFYTDIDVEFNRRNEVKSLMGISAKEDSLHWNFDVGGGLLILGSSVDSPHGRFFASARVMQLFPVYYKKRDLNATEEPPPEEEPGNKPSHGGGETETPVKPPEPEPENTADNAEENGVNYRLFRNGFAAEFSIGIRF